MEALLIMNDNARDGSDVSADDMQDALREAGYEPVYKATSSEEDLNPILRDANGLVVAAGGDGTVRAVATRLINKNVPISILPLGTANNIAKTLNIEGSPLEIISHLKNPRKCSFDVGYVRGPWGGDYFLEAMGWGLYADILEDYDPEKGKSVLRSVASILKEASEYKTYPGGLILDGEAVFGDYVMVEVLNTVAFGPRLKLAPKANTNDGMLDVVCIENDQENGVVDYIVKFFGEELEELPGVQVKRGKRLEVEWDGFPIHVDGEVRPQKNRRPPTRNPAAGERPLAQKKGDQKLEVEILRGAIEFWLPSLPPS